MVYKNYSAPSRVCFVWFFMVSYGYPYGTLRVVHTGWATDGETGSQVMGQVVVLHGVARKLLTGFPGSARLPTDREVALLTGRTQGETK